MGDNQQRSGESSGAAAEARRQRIVAVVTEMGEVTAGRLRAEVGGRTATAYADLAVLLSDGTLVVEHKGRKMLYRLAQPDARAENPARSGERDAGSLLDASGGREEPRPD